MIDPNHLQFNSLLPGVQIERVVADLQSGKGTAGKFLKDPSLYNNADATIANVKELTDNISGGKGTAGSVTNRQSRLT